MIDVEMNDVSDDEECQYNISTQKSHNVYTQECLNVNTQSYF